MGRGGEEEMGRGGEEERGAHQDKGKNKVVGRSEINSSMNKIAQKTP